MGTNLKHELWNKNTLPERIREIEWTFATQNPVGCLPLPTFLEILRIAVQTNHLAHGTTKTKTSIEMQQGLTFLEDANAGSAPKNFNPFSWADSVNLLGPLMACIYQRMHAEVQLKNQLVLPTLDGTQAN